VRPFRTKMPVLITEVMRRVAAISRNAEPQLDRLI
jgi:hypothetical protein